MRVRWSTEAPNANAHPEDETPLEQGRVNGGDNNNNDNGRQAIVLAVSKASIKASLSFGDGIGGMDPTDQLGSVQLVCIESSFLDFKSLLSLALARAW